MKGPKLTILNLASAAFLVTYDGAAVQMILPVLVDAFGQDVHAVQWTMTAFLVVSTSALLPAGRAGDLYGRDRVFRLGVLLFTLASVLCTLAPVLWVLILGRALQGLGSALISANSAALIVEAFPDSERGEALGYGNIAIGLGLVIGPAVGALITDLISWRYIFAVVVPIAAVIWWGARYTLPAPERHPEALDVGGGVLIILGLGGLLIGGTMGRPWGWTSAGTLISFSAGSIALVVFYLRERRLGEPLVDLELLAQRGFWPGAVAALLAFAALFALTVTMPFFLLQGQGRSLIEAGLIVGIVPVGLGIAAPLAGRGADRVGARYIASGGLLGIAGGFSLLQWAGPDTGLTLLLIALALVGAGVGSFEAPNEASVLSFLPSGRLGTGTATMGALRNLGMTVGVAAATTLLGYRLAHYPESVAQGATAGMHLAMWAAMGIAVVGAVVSAMRPKKAG